MNTHSPRLLSPIGPRANQASLVVSPDPQEMSSNCGSSEHAGGLETPSSDQLHHDTPSGGSSHHHHHNKKNFKTEYKSKFTPFDQYVYNENTDSFVKQAVDTQSSDTTITTSRSNQDLAGTLESKPHSATISISTHDADVFEPSSNGADNHNLSSEPWYKEVVRRNEKANEYRFKSEVGHNSPLLNYNNRADSPYTTTSSERQIISPCGTTTGSIMGDQQVDARSQHSDQQTITTCDGQQDQTKQQQQYRFTSHDFKRDPLIAHMANNNNFALPKEQPVDKKVAPRRSQLAATGGSRSAAQVRSRSQSSRRQPASTTASTASGQKAQQAATKSNQTTPTRTITAKRITVASTATTTTRAQHVTPTTATSRPPTARTTPVSSRVTSTTRPATAAPLKSATPNPIKSVPISHRVTPKPTNGTSSTTPSNRTTPSSVLAKKSTTTPAPTRTPLTAPKSATPRSATRTTPSSATATTASAKAPVRLTSANLRMNTTSTRSPITGTKSKSAPKTTPSTSSATTTVKSIKTPKALAAKEAEIAAATAATAAAAIGTGSAVGILSTLNDDQTEPSTAEQQPQQRQSIAEPSNIQTEKEPFVMQVHHYEKYVPEETNLIFTTTEGGNMLADELTQAEQKAAASSTETKNDHHFQMEQQVLVDDTLQALQATQLDRETITNTAKVEHKGSSSSSSSSSCSPSEEVAGDVDENDDKLVSVGTSELVNGLAGGLVSAEDGFDSSEREVDSTSVSDMNADSGKQTSDIDPQDQNYNDEPYSIMPTTSADAKIDNFNFELAEIEAAASKNKQENEDLLVKDSVSSDNEFNKPTATASEAMIESSNSRVISSGQQQPIKLDESEVGGDEFIRNEYRNGSDDDLACDSKSDESSNNLIGENMGDVMPKQQSAGGTVGDDSQNLNTAFEQMNLGGQVTKEEVVFSSSEIINAYEPVSSTNIPADQESQAAYRVQQDNKKDEGEVVVEKGKEQARNRESGEDIGRHRRESSLSSGLDFHNEFVNVTPDTSALNGAPALTEDPEPVLTISSSSSSTSSLAHQHSADPDDAAGPDVEVATANNEIKSEQVEEKKHEVVDMSDLTTIHNNNQSKDLIDSSPALVSANTSFQGGELNVSTGMTEHLSDSLIAEVSSPKNDNLDNLVQALQTKGTRNNDLLHDTTDDDNNIVQTKKEGKLEQPVSASSAAHDDHDRNKSPLESDDISGKKSGSGSSSSNSSDEEEISGDKNELLMNVADLVGVESRKKQEMARNAELARKNSSPQPSTIPQSGEILLSADQLTEQFAGLSSEISEQKSTIIGKNKQVESGVGQKSDNIESSDDQETHIPTKFASVDHSSKPQSIVAGDQHQQRHHSDDRMNFSERESSMGEMNADLWEKGDGDQVIDSPKKVEPDLMVNEMGSTQINIDDEIDNDEHLKLSNHLTNSDDELILEPRNYNYSQLVKSDSSQRFNETDFMAQEENRIDGTLELGGGSSAEIETTTSAENRVEMMFTSKSVVPEISQTKYMRKLTEDSSDDDDLGIIGDTDKDPFGAAATTISPKSSVVESELLRFNPVKDPTILAGLSHKNKDDEADDHDKQGQSEIKMAPSGGSTAAGNTVDLLQQKDRFDLIGSVDITTNMIDDTVKQLQQHGELHRQLNKSQQERLSSASNFDVDQALRRQQSGSKSASSSSASSASSSLEKVQHAGLKDEYEEFAARMTADIVSSKPKGVNNNSAAETDSSPSVAKVGQESDSGHSTATTNEQTSVMKSLLD